MVKISIFTKFIVLIWVTLKYGFYILHFTSGLQLVVVVWSEFTQMQIIIVNEL